MLLKLRGKIAEWRISRSLGAWRPPHLLPVIRWKFKLQLLGKSRPLGILEPADFLNL